MMAQLLRTVTVAVHAEYFQPPRMGHAGRQLLQKRFADIIRNFVDRGLIIGSELLNSILVLHLTDPPGVDEQGEVVPEFGVAGIAQLLGEAQNRRAGRL